MVSQTGVSAVSLVLDLVLESRKINAAKISGKVPKKMSYPQTIHLRPPNTPNDSYQTKVYHTVKISCWAASSIVNEQ